LVRSDRISLFVLRDDKSSTKNLVEPNQIPL